jgi:hypothetical protein
LMCVMSVIWVSKEWVRDCHCLIHSWTLYCDYWFTHSCNDCHCRCLRFGILIPVDIKILVFQDIMVCGSIDGYSEEPSCSSFGTEQMASQKIVIIVLVYLITHTNTCTYIYYLRSLKFTLKHLKRSYMFRSHDNPPGAYTVPC